LRLWSRNIRRGWPFSSDANENCIFSLGRAAGMWRRKRASPASPGDTAGSNRAAGAGAGE
jgi:hypothetical protein